MAALFPRLTSLFQLKQFLSFSKYPLETIISTSSRVACNCPEILKNSPEVRIWLPFRVGNKLPLARLLIG